MTATLPWHNGELFTAKLKQVIDNLRCGAEMLWGSISPVFSPGSDLTIPCDSLTCQGGYLPAHNRTSPEPDQLQSLGSSNYETEYLAPSKLISLPNLFSCNMLFCSCVHICM